MEHKISEKLPFKVRLSYGLSGYTSFITWTLFSMYGLFFFTDIVGLNPTFAGAIISLGTLWDAITDPIVGSISDNLKCKYGRRRPLIIGVAIPFAIISVLLFTNFGLSEGASKVYYVVIILLYYTAQTVLDIASSSLGSEMTLDYDERSTLATFKNFFCMVVMIIISPTLMMVTYFDEKFAGYGWSATVAVFMLIALVFIYTLWRNTRGYEKHLENSASKFELKDIKEIFKNKSARIVMLIFAIAIFGKSINLAIQVYYYSYYVQMSEGQIASVMAYAGFLGCFAAIGIDVLCKKCSKKAAWIIACGIEGASMIALVGIFIKPGQLTMIYVLVTLMALGLAAIYQVPWSMIPDCVDVQELATKKRLDGIVFGFIAFIQKVSGAVAIALVGTILEIIGYNAAGVQTQATLGAMKAVYGFGCGGVLILTVLIVLAYPLSKKRHNDVLKALEDRSNGKEIDIKKFKDLI